MKIRSLIISVFGIAGLGASVHAADDMCFEKAQTQSQLTACADQALKREDEELNRLYKQMQNRLKGDDDTRRLLTNSQRKWIAFRDAECAFATVRTAGGSINTMNVNNCLTALTRNRAIELQNHLACAKGADEQTAQECALPR